jgi:DNA-binding response OmpR family regulator
MLQQNRGPLAILCVDHDAESNALLRELLSEYKLVFASSALQALTLLRADLFHAYILDYWLPDWSGPILCREIRKIDPHGPVIFCAAAAKDQDKVVAFRAGATAYLCKPVNSELLTSRLRVLLTLAELESVHARVEEQRAIQDELQRCVVESQLHVDKARQLVRSSLERTAKVKAYKAFVQAHGSRAYFESWWSEVFSSGSASVEQRQRRG